MSNSNRRQTSQRLFLFFAILLGLAPISAAGADPSLRWLPSASPEVTGYVVHVGAEPGFFAERAAVAQIDIGTDYTLQDGIAHHPLSALISQSAWVVMTAYGAGGVTSEPSNEIYAEIPVVCSSNSDCDDGNFCNGAEVCNAGTCVGGDPPACGGGDACNVASCDELAGCLVTPAPDGLWCNDGDPETFADVCSAGSCRGEVSSDSSSESFFTEDFESSAAGSDAVGWTDTAAGSHSQISDDFHVGVMSDGNHVLETTSSATNLHSHLMDGGSADWHSYELSGRMRIASSSGGIGVTIYSEFPNEDRYYRLRRYDGNNFHFAPHPNGHDSCVGDTDTGVRPSANRWYAFRFRAFPENGGTRVQAKVWDVSSAEPASWQADCMDPIATALQAGAPGVWSMGAGAKYWDELEVSDVASAAPPEPEPECVTDPDCSDGDACTGAERCSSGRCEAGSPLSCSGGDQCRVASCDAALGCVLAPVANGSACNDQDLCTAQDSCQAGVCTGGGALSCPAPNPCQAGYCDPLQGCGAENLPDGRACDDGDASTENDVCSAGSCRGSDIVEPEPEPDCSGDLDCSDGNACNGAERCQAGLCVAGSPLDCTTGNACEVARCDVALGCVVEPAPNGTSCNDENLCTAQDSCQAGVCTAGGALSCPAPNPCQAGYCDPLQGCSAENLPDGRVCDDGDPNTGNDACSAGSCRGEPLEGPEPEGGLLFEDFEQYAAGDDPDGWFDTAAGNSLAEDPRAFEVIELGDGNRVLGTNATESNLHSHYVAGDSVQWTEYEYRGRMQIGAGGGGIGVTLYSDYPNSDSYYRLRRYQNGRFHLASHPDDVVSCVGAQDTGVRPKHGEWYRFRFQAFAEGDGTRLRARVWVDSGAEPLNWQVDCVTTGFGTFYSGSPGVWSMGAGAKYWDDLEVVELSEASGEGPPGGASGSPAYSESFESYSEGASPENWLDTARNNSLEEDPSLFSVVEEDDGNRAFGTTPFHPNVHSHLFVEGGEQWSDYEYSGRMQVGDRDGGIGVTLYSDYPNSDRYYRLRRIAGTVFDLSEHPDNAGFCIGRTHTGVMPFPEVWYRFRFEAKAAGAATRLRAKVWPEIGSEPDEWQIDCAVEGSVALRAGRPGIWSTGPGEKRWDDLEIKEPETP